MSSSTSEEKKNPVVTLKAQAEKFDYRALRANTNIRYWEDKWICYKLA